MDASGAGHRDWLDRAAALTLPDRLVIDGRLVPAKSGVTPLVVSPRDGACLAEVCEGAPADVDATNPCTLEKYTELKTTWIAL